MSQFLKFNGGGVIPPGTAVVSLTPDSGTSPVVPNGAGDINVLGGLNINTVGSLNTITINLDNDVILTNAVAGVSSSFLQFDKSRVGGIITTGDQLGEIIFTGDDGVTQIVGASIVAQSTGTIGANRIPTELLFYTHQDAVVGAPTLNMTLDEDGILTLHQYSLGVVQSSAAGVLSSSDGSDGQVLIASSAAGVAPAWANITSTGGSVEITNGSNTINLEVTDTLNLSAVTVDATPLVVTSLLINEDEAYLFTVKFMGAIDDYSESLGGQKWATAARALAGGTNLSDTNGLTSKTVGIPDGVDFTFGLSGNSVTFLVTGEAVTTYNWKLQISWIIVDA